MALLSRGSYSLESNNPMRVWWESRVGRRMVLSKELFISGLGSQSSTANSDEVESQIKNKFKRHQLHMPCRPPIADDLSADIEF